MNGDPVQRLQLENSRFGQTIERQTREITALQSHVGKLEGEIEALRAETFLLRYGGDCAEHRYQLAQTRDQLAALDRRLRELTVLGIERAVGDMAAVGSPQLVEADGRISTTYTHYTGRYAKSADRPAEAAA